MNAGSGVQLADVGVKSQNCDCKSDPPQVVDSTSRVE
jgi:hypothetical protein